MSCLIVALGFLAQVYLAIPVSASPTILNDAAIHLTCSGEDSIPSSLVVSDRLHPLHGAITLKMTCGGSTDYSDANYPLPVHMDIYYGGDASSRCVFTQTPTHFQVIIDVRAYGEYSVGTKTVTCPRPKASTAPLSGTMPDYPVTSISNADMRDYVWTRCGVTSNYMEIIPLAVKAVAAITCKLVTHAYTIETDTPVEVTLHKAGNAHSVCVFKVGDPRQVDVSFFKYSTFEYIGTGTVTYCPPRTDTFILDVIPHCGNAVGASAWVRGVADVDADFRAICKGDYTYVFNNLNNDDVNYKLPVLYSGNPTANCVFDRRENSNVYVITVQASWGESGAVVHKHTREYQVTCTFDAKGSDDTANQNIDETLIAPKVIQTFDGSLAASYINLHLMDVLDRQVYALPLGRMVRLRLWSNGRGTEVGIRPVGCDIVGVGSGQRFAIIRAGCGDGILFAKDKGFTTDGLNSTSPYFKTFSMHDDTRIKFECNVTMCESNCDGDSCSDTVIRRRRSSRDIFFTENVLVESRRIHS